jgi:uncharacterized protein (TIGR02996 family)
MSTHADFLHAIAAHPDEDAPRLIYADWLEEQGESDRADFIRVQCELAQLPETEHRRAGLEMRQNQLLQRHCKAWLGVLPVQPPWRLRNGTFYEYERGFLTALCVRAQDFLDHAPTLFAAAPLLRHVRFKNLQDRIVKVLYSGYLHRLTAIDLSYENLFDTDTDWLWQFQGDLHGLRDLYLTGNRLTNDAVAYLSQTNVFRNLEVLDLSYNRVGDHGALALAASTTFPRLQLLRLDRNPVNWDVREQVWRMLEARGCRLQCEPEEE